MKKYILLILLILPVLVLAGIVYAGHDDGCGATNSCTTGTYCDGTTLFRDEADGTHTGVENCADRGSGWNCADGACVQSGGGDDGSWCTTGNHKCGNVGTIIPGGCTKDGKTCTKYETYQCNFGGVNYCGPNGPNAECKEPCGSGYIGPVGTVACKTPLTPTELGINNCSVCDRLHEYVLVAPISKGGGPSDCSPANNNSCTKNSDCPENRDQPNLIVPTGSNWCYGFKDGARCLKLRYKGTGAEPSCGPGDTPRDPTTCDGGGVCDIDGQTPDMGLNCANCLSTQTSPTNVPGVITNIKNMNPTKFSACSNQEILNKWCNDFGATAAQQCLELKNGVCATSCGGSSPPPSGSLTAPACASPASGSTVSPNNMTFSWGSVSGASVYHFRLWDYNTGGWNDANWLKESIIINDLTTTSYSGSGGRFLKNDYGSPINLPTGQNYRYRVAAANSSNVGPWVDCNFAVSSAATPTPTPTPSAAFTVSYKWAETLVELNAAEWKPYDTEPIKIDDFKFKDSTPGVKSIFVQFKDSNERVSCGENKDYCTAQIRILGPEPKITGCDLNFEGNNAILNLTGENFGSTKGVVKGGGADLQEVREWVNSSIKVVWPNAPTGQTLNLTLTTQDGQSAEGSCSAISQLALGARIFCRQPFAQQTDNVELVLAGAFEGGTLIKQTVSIDKDGVIQGLKDVKLEAGKRYILSLKAPKSLRRSISFIAEEGTTNISGFVLPVGDIFPAAAGDGKINAPDKSELNTQFSLTKDVCTRSGDFNKDCRVNSIDWACMRVSMPDAACSGDNPEPVAGPQAEIPAPTCQIVISGGASPSPRPSLSPSPSPSPSP